MILVLIFIILGFLLGCNNSHIFRDYFPLKEGNQWLYTDGVSEFLSYVEDYDSCYYFVLSDRRYFLTKNHSDIYNRIELVKTYNGEKITFGSIDELYLPNPLIDGDKFLEEKRFEKLISGDTVFFNYKNQLNVTFVGNITGIKNYSSCYLVERLVIYDKDTLIIKEYYAPDIGLIKYETNEKVWDLKEWYLY